MPWNFVAVFPHPLPSRTLLPAVSSVSLFPPWLSSSLPLHNSTSLSLIFSLRLSLLLHLLMNPPPALFSFSAFAQILICSRPSHLSLFLRDSAFSILLFTLLTFSYFFARQEVVEIKGGKRWKEAQLTPHAHNICTFSFLSNSSWEKCLPLNISATHSVLLLLLLSSSSYTPPHLFLLLRHIPQSHLIWIYVSADISPRDQSKHTPTHELHAKKDEPALSERFTRLRDEMKKKKKGLGGENRD